MSARRRKLLEAAIDELGPDQAFDLYEKLQQKPDTGDRSVDMFLGLMGQTFNEDVQEEDQGEDEQK